MFNRRLPDPKLLLVVLVAALILGCGSDNRGQQSTGSQTNQFGSIDVLGIWGADELQKFSNMVAPWEQRTSSKVDFTGTRDITAQLTVRVEGGNPPDVAIPAEVGLFQEFARTGKLAPLSACPGLESRVRAEYPQNFLDLGTVDGKLYGFFMKADSKGTIWYNPRFFREHGLQPLTAESKFDDLISLSDRIRQTGIAPWSIGLESGQATGWPGSDWIQQILLNQSGAEVYDGVINGSIPYTDQRVKDAWERFGRIALNSNYVVQGGPQAMLATNFQDSAFPPYEQTPRAGLVALGGFASGFIKDQYPRASAGNDYNFFPWPGGAVTGGANIVYAFNSEPGTCSLLEWLAGSEAQEMWVKAGGFTSVNKGVPLESYPDEVSRQLARQLTTARVFRFDQDDALGGAVQQAIFQGVTQYLQNPNSLDRILANIAATRR
jgi:alpha-glucoside transport system substrate-binding protein